jgi:hypothetical protein
MTPPGEKRLSEEAARLQANAVVAISRLRPAGAMRRPAQLTWSGATDVY